MGFIEGLWGLTRPNGSYGALQDVMRLMGPSKTLWVLYWALQDVMGPMGPYKTLWVLSEHYGPLWAYFDIY